jgi:hypothetical protein
VGIWTDRTSYWSLAIRKHEEMLYHTCSYSYDSSLISRYRFHRLSDTRLYDRHFQGVWHLFIILFLLIIKLQALGVHPCLINWCADFLRCRYLRVKVGTNKSSWKLMHAGVPRGTKLGPLLFLVMINDLKTLFPLYKYVDDCILYEVVLKPYISETRTRRFQRITYLDWANNNMLLNVKKTK